MAATMLGAHSSLRILAGAAALVVLAIALAPLARRSPVVRGHVVDCFAMGLALIVSLSGPMDAAGSPSPHAHALAIPSLAALALVAAGWAAAREIGRASCRERVCELV